jgi:hypothetical protein
MRYIRKFEIKRDEYERRVLCKLREMLLEEESLVEREGRIEVEDVRLDTSGPLHQVHILFRDPSRPECLFGYWAEALEEETDPLSDHIVLNPLKGYWGPEDWANMIIVTHFEEQVDAVGLGLPPDCDSEAITWINNYRSLPPERARRELPEMTIEEMDELYEDWDRTTPELSCLFDKRGWFVSGSVGYSVTGSDRAGRADFSYHIIAYRPVIEAVRRGEKPVFELYDEERGVVAYVHEVPTPEQVARFLEQNGISIEKVDDRRATLPNLPDGIVKDQ